MGSANSPTITRVWASLSWCWSSQSQSPYDEKYLSSACGAILIKIGRILITAFSVHLLSLYSLTRTQVEATLQHLRCALHVCTVITHPQYTSNSIVWQRRFPALGGPRVIDPTGSLGSSSYIVKCHGHPETLALRIYAKTRMLAYTRAFTYVYILVYLVCNTRVSIHRCCL